MSNIEREQNNNPVISNPNKIKEIENKKHEINQANKNDSLKIEKSLVNNKIIIRPNNSHKQTIEFKWENVCIQPKKELNKPKTKKSAEDKKQEKQKTKIEKLKEKEKQKTKKFLLENVSGSVKTGETLAIIGASGAGKTTLLNFLSKKITTKNLICSGKITLNNIEIISSNKNNQKNENKQNLSNINNVRNESNIHIDDYKHENNLNKHANNNYNNNGNNNNNLSTSVNNISKVKNLKLDLPKDPYGNLKLGNSNPVDSRVKEQAQNVPSNSANAAYAAANIKSSLNKNKNLNDNANDNKNNNNNKNDNNDEKIKKDKSQNKNKKELSSSSIIKENNTINNNNNHNHNLNHNDSHHQQKQHLNFIQESDFEAISSYVMQDDIIEATMTPLEILLFTAKLKLNLPQAQIEKKVFEMLEDLNLQNCQNTKIGNTIIRGVSGGERKRTSIAVELISDPKIIFLDEPTTGLDSYNAYKTLEILFLLSKKHLKIIIFTVHQPSSEIFFILDKLCILADGKTVFFGAKENAVGFFCDNLKLALPLNYNPFEFFMEVTSFEVLGNARVKAVKAYLELLEPGAKEDAEDLLKQQCYSNFICLLNDVFEGQKILRLKEKDGFNDNDVGNYKKKNKNFNDEFPAEDGQGNKNKNEFKEDGIPAVAVDSKNEFGVFRKANNGNFDDVELNNRHHSLSNKKQVNNEIKFIDEINNNNNNNNHLDKRKNSSVSINNNNLNAHKDNSNEEFPMLEYYAEEIISAEDAKSKGLFSYRNLKNVEDEMENSYDENNKKYNEMIQNLKQTIAVKKHTKGFFYEFSMLYHRNTVVALRNKKILILKLLENFLIGTLFAVLFMNLTKNYSGIHDRSGLCLLILVNTILATVTQTIMIFADEKKVFMRERANNMYSVASYFLAKTLGEFPIYFISVNILLGIVYPSANLNDTYSYKYYVSVGISQLCALTGASYAFFLGSLASNQEMLTNINTALSIPLLLMSGFFASSENFAPYLIPFEYLSAFKYGFQSLMQNEFVDIQPLNCMNNLFMPCDPLTINYSFREAMWLSIICLALLIVFFKFLAYVFTYIKSRRRN